MDAIKTLKLITIDDTLTKLEDIDNSRNANIKSEKGVGSLTTIASMM
ncbi:MAG: hypothetical protein ACLTA5_03275 [Anaerococcus obesiensis]